MARIVRIHAYGDASVLKLEDVDVPAPPPMKCKSTSKPSASTAPK